MNKEDVTNLNYIIDSIKTSLLGKEDRIKSLTNLLIEDYMFFIIYESIILKSDAQVLSISNNEAMNIFKNKQFPVIASLSALNGDLDEFKKLKDLDCSMYSFRRKLEKRKLHLHFFGLENLNSEELYKTQEFLNCIVSWRIRGSKTNLYTKNNRLAHYKVNDRFYLEKMHDYEYVKYSPKVYTKERFNKNEK